MTAVASSAAIVATVLAGVALIPQIRRLVTTKISDGVSPTWAGFGVVTNAAWAIYLASQSLWLAIPSTLVVSVFYAATLGVLTRLRSPARAAVVSSAVSALVLAAAGVGGGWPALGTLLGFSYGFQAAPGIWRAYRTWAPRGISPATWWVTVAEAGLWGAYGVIVADRPIVIFAVTAGAASLLMLGRYAATRARWATADAVGSSATL
jgi:uncharacterized protein with PQ loop repeat